MIQIANLILAYTLDEIRAIPEPRARMSEVVLQGARTRWMFVPNSQEEDDSTDWLLPDWQPTGRPGRWGRWQTPSGSGGGVTLPIEISDVNGLQTELDSLQSEIDAAATLPIAESDVTGLTGDLAGLAADIASEASSRASADSALTSRVDALGAGAGLTRSVDTFAVGAGDGIQVDADSVTVKLDGTTLSKSGSGLKVNAIPESAVTNLTTDLAAKEATANKGAASGYASLNSSTKVVEDPANATATPTASKIVKADGSGKVDGWVSDADATTKGIHKLANDLGGTAALPKVVAITETTGPTQLVIGSIADGEYLKRVGGTLVSSALTGGALSSEDDFSYDRLDLNWFSRQSLLPSTKIKLAFKDFPAFTGVSAGSDTYNLGRVRLSTAAYARWALGAAYTKVLIAIGFMRSQATNANLWVCDTLSGSTPNDGNMFSNNNSSSSVNFKMPAFSVADSSAEMFMAVSASSWQAAMALYYDCSAHRMICFYRMGPGTWFPILDTTSATNVALSQIQYAGLHFNSQGFANTPVAVYAQ